MAKIHLLSCQKVSAGKKKTLSNISSVHIQLTSNIYCMTFISSLEYKETKYLLKPIKQNNQLQLNISIRL